MQVVAGGRLALPPTATQDPERLKLAQERALAKVMEQAGISSRSVVAGVSGQSAFIRNIKLPPIPESRVDQIVRYEVQQTIPFKLDEIAVDYQLLKEDNAAEMEVVLVAMKGEVCEQFIAHVSAGKVKPVLVDANPLAIYNAYVHNGYSNQVDCTAILDFGATTTTILIEYDGQLRFTRCVGLGGSDISQLLANELGCSYEEAERTKIKAGLLFPPPGPAAKVTENQRRISAVLTRAVDRLLGEVKLSIGYFRTQTGAVAVSRAFICGGGAQLRNLRPLIADRLGVQVEFLNPFRKVKLPPEKGALKRQALEFVTTLGHALRGVAPCAIEINLQPPRLIARRKRQVELACYAASFGLLILASFLGGAVFTPDIEADRVQLVAVEQAIAPFKEFEEERAKLASQLSILREDFLLRSRILQQDVPLFVIMELLTDNMDGGVFIEDLRIDGGKNELFLTGYADAGDEETNFSHLFELSKVLQAITEEEPELKRTALSGREERVKFQLRVTRVPRTREAYLAKREVYLAEKQAATAQAEATAAAQAAAEEAPDAGEAS